VEKEETMTTFNLELNNKPNKNGLYNVQVRITQDKRHKRIKTSVYIKSRTDFNANAKNDNWIRKNEPFHVRYNAILVDEIIKAKDVYQTLKADNKASLENIKSTIVSSETSGSFLEFAKLRTTEIYNQGNYRNSKKYNTFRIKLEKYLETINKSDLLFSEITTGFLTKFETYLRTIENTRKKEKALLHNNYVVKLLDTFKALATNYLKTNDIADKLNPFDNFKIAATTPTHKIKLSITEIEKIETLDLPVNSLIWHSRNCFLFSFYFAGIRAADVLQMRWKNLTSERRLRYQMDKAEKYKDFNIHDKALELIKLYKNDAAKPNDYIFPFLDSNADYAQANTPQMIATLSPELTVKLLNTVNSKNTLIDKYLKKIGRLVGIEENLTMHIARHSFAKRAADLKISNNINKSLLGHSNLKETETYMGDFSTQETDDAMNTIFSYRDDPKTQLIDMIKEMDNEQAKQLINQLKN
jgi:integrase